MNHPALDPKATHAAVPETHPSLDPQPGGVGEPASPVPPAPGMPLAEGPGTIIGPYKLLEQIGEGGMGTVFLAEQEQPLRRKVALKVIKPGMDTAQVIARFEAERQALALMDHPNIARVLDAGATATGRPYFVMELVQGAPITEFCDRNHLTPRERLGLFLAVCRAIHHAHQKGIIHRDIKPSNILVGSLDGRPEAKVIDFGVAKAIEQRLTERTMFTEFGAVVGTLEYMSPEQADMGALDVDTRSDIYSLGVLLYELLTGSTPLERGKLRWVAYAEILRRVREEEPPKPSTRLSESKDDALPSISAQRKTEPVRLSKMVRGELDWIVMKALDKDRTRRYETANGFARDVQRYLDGDAVEASPPSARYRLGKFARKHRSALATAGSFAVLLVGATVLSVVLALRADRARGRAVAAERSALEQKGLAQEAARQAKDQQARALDREGMAIDAVQRFADVVRDIPELKNTPALASLRGRLMQEPQAFFRRLKDRLQGDGATTAESLDRLAMASFELGNLAAEIGDKPTALRAFEESLGVRERLVRENPSDANFARNLAAAHGSVGNQLVAVGRPDEALRSYDQAAAILERLTVENPTALRYWLELAATYHNKGNLLVATNRLDDALAAYKQAQEIRECLARDNPSQVRLATELAGGYNAIGLQQVAAGRRDEALESHEHAREILERLTANNQAVSQAVLTNLAGTYANIANCHAAAQHLEEALASYRLAFTIDERLARASPSVDALQLSLAKSYYNIGSPLAKLGRRPEALASYEHAREILERLVVEHPESPDNAFMMAGTLNNLSLLLYIDEHPEEARTRIRQAIDYERKARAANPLHPAYRKSMGDHWTNLLRVATKLGRADEVAEATRELAELAATDPSRLALEARLNAVVAGEPARNSGERLALAALANGKGLYAPAARLFAEAFADNPQLAADRGPQHRYNAACNAALAASGQGKDDPPLDDSARARLRHQALGWLQAELAAWTDVCAAGPAEPRAKVAATMTHWKADTDLVALRDAAALDKLPPVDQAECRHLWDEVDALLARATAGK